MQTEKCKSFHYLAPQKFKDRKVLKCLCESVLAGLHAALCITMKLNKSLKIKKRVRVFKCENALAGLRTLEPKCPSPHLE